MTLFVLFASHSYNSICTLLFVTERVLTVFVDRSESSCNCAIKLMCVTINFFIKFFFRLYRKLREKLLGKPKIKVVVATSSSVAGADRKNAIFFKQSLGEINTMSGFSSVKPSMTCNLSITLHYFLKISNQLHFP